MIIKDDVLRSGNESKVDPEYQPRTVLLDEVDEDKRHKGSSEELAQPMGNGEMALILLKKSLDALASSASTRRWLPALGRRGSGCGWE